MSRRDIEERINLIKVLLKYGADVKLKVKHPAYPCWNALDYAESKDEKEFIDLLRSHGAKTYLEESQS